jgi:hypothetical protein
VFEPEVCSSLVRLQELRLEDNLIKSISPAPATALPQLRVLHVGGNRLLDGVQCCQRLTSLPVLLELAVAGNPFTRKQASPCCCVAVALWRGSCLKATHVESRRFTLLVLH